MSGSASLWGSFTIKMITNIFIFYFHLITINLSIHEYFVYLIILYQITSNVYDPLYLCSDNIIVYTLSLRQEDQGKP